MKWLITGLILVVLWVEFNLFKLTVACRDALAPKSKAYTHTTIVREAVRGQIRDRNGLPVAISTPAASIYTDPGVWSNRIDTLCRVVAPLLNVSEPALALRVRSALVPSAARTDTHGTRALLLKRQVMLEDWERIQAALAKETFGLDTNHWRRADRVLLQKLRRHVMFAREEPIRLYPYAPALAHVTGFVGRGTNGHWIQGRWGIEGSFDVQLAGVNGACASEHDAAGNELPLRRTSVAEPLDGYHVTLTIDMRLQLLVERLLDEAVARPGPRSASVVVVRPKTGEILALACRPTYSPQTLGLSPREAWINHPISDMIEPGSVMKTFVLAAALDLGVVSLDQVIHCGNGRFVYRNTVLRDHASYGWLSVRDAFAKSSNPAFAQIALKVGPERLYAYVTHFGFGRRSGVPLANEMPGMLNGLANWTDVALVRIAIGQGISVTQLQLTMAMSALANNGLLMRPLLVQKVESADGKLLAKVTPQAVRQVVRPHTAALLRDALTGVVSPKGTGSRAALEAYLVAGKTSTAQKANTNGYLRGAYTSSFTGFLPAADPELCISVVFDEPPADRPHGGGALAAPLFRDIAAGAVELLRVPPDPTVPAVDRRHQVAALAPLTAVAPRSR